MQTTMTTDLDTLLSRIADGDTEAFAEFYDATKARVFGLVTRVLQDRGTSEETTRDVFVQVWEIAPSYESQQGSALSWLMTLAHRRAVERRRAERVASRRDFGLAELAGVLNGLGGLGEPQRQCIEMAYYSGLTYTQVSQTLSTSQGTVKTRMRDGLRNLAECLGAS